MRRNAVAEPGHRLYTFLSNGSVEIGHWTYRDLDSRARAIAASLLDSAAPGDRAVLLYPHGPEFIAGFFGCLYAGVVAVPVYPPRSARGNDRLQSILVDSRPRLALTSSSVLPRVESLVRGIPQLAGLDCLATDGLPPERG
ncbi:MAG TPA: AMP-binding protein, partial [Thermoanaerobaculia bacterium]|nr:AMP-binding protein [Thermoanaerobaculia bacterium]